MGNTLSPEFLRQRERRQQKLIQRMEERLANNNNKEAKNNNDSDDDGDSDIDEADVCGNTVCPAGQLLILAMRLASSSSLTYTCRTEEDAPVHHLCALRNRTISGERGPASSSSSSSPFLVLLPLADTAQALLHPLRAVIQWPQRSLRVEAYEPHYPHTLLTVFEPPVREDDPDEFVDVSIVAVTQVQWNKQRAMALLIERANGKQNHCIRIVQLPTGQRGVTPWATLETIELEHALYDRALVSPQPDTLVVISRCRRSKEDPSQFETSFQPTLVVITSTTTASSSSSSSEAVHHQQRHIDLHPWDHPQIRASVAKNGDMSMVPLNDDGRGGQQRRWILIARRVVEGIMLCVDISSSSSSHHDPNNLMNRERVRIVENAPGSAGRGGRGPYNTTSATASSSSSSRHLLLPGGSISLMESSSFPSSLSCSSTPTTSLFGDEYLSKTAVLHIAVDGKRLDFGTVVVSGVDDNKEEATRRNGEWKCQFQPMASVPTPFRFWTAQTVDSFRSSSEQQRQKGGHDDDAYYHVALVPLKSSRCGVYRVSVERDEVSAQKTAAAAALARQIFLANSTQHGSNDVHFDDEDHHHHNSTQFVLSRSLLCRGGAVEGVGRIDL